MKYAKNYVRLTCVSEKNEIWRSLQDADESLRILFGSILIEVCRNIFVRVLFLIKASTCMCFYNNIICLLLCNGEFSIKVDRNTDELF